MAPIVSDLKHKESGTARVLGSGTSGMFVCLVEGRWCSWCRTGIAELLIFHPVDTIAKRLMSNKAKVCPPPLSLPLLFPHGPPQQASASNLSTIIFREHAAAPLGRRLMSLFPGLGYAAGYKVAQRVYKFGGQPYFNDFIVQNYKSSFTNAFGERKGKMMMQATAGSLTGIGEVVSACAAGCLPVGACVRWCLLIVGRWM